VASSQCDILCIIADAAKLDFGNSSLAVLFCCGAVLTIFALYTYLLAWLLICGFL